MSTAPPENRKPVDHESPSSSPLFSEQTLMAAIVKRAHEFTLPALLDALLAVGLRAEEVLFRSHQSHSHHAFLVHKVEFLTEPRQAVVTLNIGLLAAQGPLPSYFFSALEGGAHDADAILALLYLVDHPLLRERARAEYPERDRRSFNDWEQSKGLLLRLMALQSPSSLHWLFQRVFPELAVRVERAADELLLSTEQVIVGLTALGESQALGGRVKLTTGALSVTLYCEEASTALGRPWVNQAAHRLERHILPLLQEQPLFLNVWVVFFNRDSVAHLSTSVGAPDGFLGYDPLSKPASRPVALGGMPVVLQSSQRVLLFNGYTDFRDLSDTKPVSA